ncbi:MAG: hypothetical protein EP340_07790 [Alphaproteobacteria bacterium]|nr:MAG: hypothetical protein EP340_07790 [Alphaproteobacteria bacterium]
MSQSSSHQKSNLPALMPEDLARQIVDQAMTRYFNKCRDRIPEFVDRHFSPKGAWALNKKAFGRDLYRAPLNVALVGPALGAKAAAKGIDKIAKTKFSDKFGDKRFYFQTDVANELEWFIYTDLLEVPYAQPGRHSDRDALAEEIFGHGKFIGALEEAVEQAVAASGARNRHQLEHLLSTYLETRAANAEVVNLAVCLTAGAALAHKVTPGVLSLGPAMANTISAKAAVSSFPLGSTLGSAWYSAFPVAPSAALAASTTGGILAIASVVTAFSGLISDPLQRKFGLHERRLNKLVDAIEDNIRYDEVIHLKVRDHYVARIADLFDALAAIAAYAR